MLDAYAIWLHARAAVTSAQYPSRLDYTIAIAGLDGQTPTSDHYRASSDTSDGSVRVFPISDEQLAKPPPAPHGINVSVNAAICIGLCWVIHQPIGHPAPYQDLIGEPLLEPMYMFGLRYAIPQRKAAEQDEETTLRTIAVVSTGAPIYRVELIDQPELDGVPTYHLRLTPLRKPKENRLRELWIGANDYLPRRAITAGNFTLRPLTDVPWTVDFTVVDGARFFAEKAPVATFTSSTAASCATQRSPLKIFANRAARSTTARCFARKRPTTRSSSPSPGKATRNREPNSSKESSSRRTSPIGAL